MAPDPDPQERHVLGIEDQDLDSLVRSTALSPDVYLDSTIFKGTQAWEIFGLQFLILSFFVLRILSIRRTIVSLLIQPTQTIFLTKSQYLSITNYKKY